MPHTGANASVLLATLSLSSSYDDSVRPVLPAGNRGLWVATPAPTLSNEGIERGGFHARRITSYNVCYTKLLRSDVASIRTTARKDGGDYVINGAKTYITNGTRADFITLAVRTGGEGFKGISLIRNNFV